MENYDEDIDRNVDSIINQLKNQSRSFKKPDKKEILSMDKADREQFIMDKASEVVTGCVEIINIIQDEIKCAPDAKLIESGAAFVNAFTSALETLNRLEISKQKIESQKEIALMNASAKLQTKTESDKKEGLYLSREDLIKSVLEYKKDEIKTITSDPVDI